jgi:chitinase
VAPPAPPVAITISPQSVDLPPGATQKFTSQVTGSNDTSVAWTLAEGQEAGTISSDGTYTAPAVAGTYHVVAQSRADPARSVAGTVNVTHAPSSPSPSRPPPPT